MISISLPYRNAPQAIEWLCEVFGLGKHAIYPGENGTIMHSELTLGPSVLMVHSMRPGTPYAELVRHPDEVGGVETASISLTVPDADEVYRRAVARGAKMIFDIEDKPYGGRAFTCRDPEGHIWNVGHTIPLPRSNRRQYR